jgi:hypothetical protein
MEEALEALMVVEALEVLMEEVALMDVVDLALMVVEALVEVLMEEAVVVRVLVELTGAITIQVQPLIQMMLTLMLFSKETLPLLSMVPQSPFFKSLVPILVSIFPSIMIFQFLLQPLMENNHQPRSKPLIVSDYNLRLKKISLVPNTKFLPQYKSILFQLSLMAVILWLVPKLDQEKLLRS